MSRVCLTRHLEMLLSFVSLGFYIVSSPVTFILDLARCGAVGKSLLLVLSEFFIHSGNTESS